MSLKNRLAKIERNTLAHKKVHFIGWSDCEWRYAEGLTRQENESKEDFFKRVRMNTSKKYIWCT